MLKPLLVATVLVCTGCGRSADEAKVIGVWQCNPRNGTIWRMTFSADHRLTMAIPRDATVDANDRDAKFDKMFSGTWHIERDEVVYTVTDKNGSVPKTTTRMKLSEFERAPPLGVDREAYLERL